MQENNVVIISNNKPVAEQLASKIVLLRTIDCVGIFDYENALKYLQKNEPDLIIIYAPSNESPDILKQIKFNQSLANVPIIFATDSLNQDLLCIAFDNGISDFMTLNLNETQILMKTMWGLQKRQLLKELKNKSDLLKSLEVIDHESGILTKQYTEKVFRQELQNINQKQENSIFMILSADVSCKNILPQSFLASILKKTLRKEDIIGLAQDNKFYILLKKTDKEGANKVYEKIKNNLSDSYSISASATEITKDKYETTERLLNKGLMDAMMQSSSLVFIDKKQENKAYGWLDKSDLKETNFKMFKQVFMKKIYSTITPVFFQMQTILQDKLFETKIEQHVNESESLFYLEKLPFKSCLKIKYPGYTKINIDVIHLSDKDKNSERTTFDINQLTQASIEEFLNKLIKTFKEKSN